MRILVANRGEIAVRIAKACQKLDIEPIACYTEDDQNHVKAFDSKSKHLCLKNTMPTAYMNADEYIEFCLQYKLAALHPGYGFLSESPVLAQLCEQNGIHFIGPSSEHLQLLGNKASALKLAHELNIPTLKHFAGKDLAAIMDYFEQQQSVDPNYIGMLKATAGGGGRGMALINNRENLRIEYKKQSAIANKFFGSAEIYIEQYLPDALHLEAQVSGNGSHITICGVRDCSIQRNRQKIIEITPSAFANKKICDTICSHAKKMADHLKITGLATFEFLVDKSNQQVFFIECNPRCQVEHTITEEYFGVDLVAEQIISCTKGLEAKREKKFVQGYQTGALAAPANEKLCIQLRLCAEQMSDQGVVTPCGGDLDQLDYQKVVRIDSSPLPFKHNEQFDSLMAKLIFCKDIDIDAQTTLGKLSAEISQDLQGNTLSMDSNAPLLQKICDYLSTSQNHAKIQTNWLQNRSSELNNSASAVSASLDPLAVLVHGKKPTTLKKIRPVRGNIRLDFQGLLLSNETKTGQKVEAGQLLAIVEAMKMEHEIVSDCTGIVTAVNFQAGQTIPTNSILIEIKPDQSETTAQTQTTEFADLEKIRTDLQEVLDRKAKHFDENRPKAVARRRKTNQRTVRENIEDLCDANSFREYGDMSVAAQRNRRSMPDLIDNTPGDGMVCGIGTVNAQEFGSDNTQCMLMSYDYTVLAGTQGKNNHTKKDRMFKIAIDESLPVVLFAEGGGGRPGDVDVQGVAGLDCLAFRYFGELSGQVPLVGIVSGRCFAGNAALLGCCDVIIATENSNIGMGGPAMIEGGGLGIYTPDEIGPIEVQTANGVVDIAVADETQAIAVAKKYLSYFQGDAQQWEEEDQRKLRHIIPENRMRVYPIRDILANLFDKDSVMELRRDFGLGMVTALGRVKGKTVGIIANDPKQMSGAIQSDGADKAARFLQLCDAYDFPVVSLIDTPGIMVGPEAEATALVRHASRLFVVSSGIDVPVMAVIVRKAYGLGAQAMAAGGFHSTLFSISWPTGEFGGMGLEGATKLAYRKELEAETDIAKRRQMYDTLVAKAYERGKAINMASFLEIDTVIDPIQTREWLDQGILVHRASSKDKPKSGRKFIDTW